MKSTLRRVLIAAALILALAPNAQADTLNALRDAAKNGKLANLIVHDEPRNLPKLNLVDHNQNPFDLSSRKGKIILLNLWATWCAPCRVEMPALNDLQKKLGGKHFNVVAVSLDRDHEKSRRFYKNENINALELIFDAAPPSTSAALRIRGLPATLLINRNGHEIARFIGPAEWNSKDAVDVITFAMQNF